MTLAVLALVTIVAFESMAVSTAMPDVALELHAVRSYGFAFSVMLTAQLLGIVLAGVWTDRSGPLPGRFVGQALLAGGAATCGSATRLDVFLLGRALTGLGGGLLVVMLYVIAGRVYPEAIRPRLFTYISAAWVVPSLAGPPLSAWLTENVSWRWVFWVVVVPVARHMGVALARPAPGRHLRPCARRLRPRPRAPTSRGVGRARGRPRRGGAPARHPRAGPRVVAEDACSRSSGCSGSLLVAPLLAPPAATCVMAPGLPRVVLARALLCAAFYGGITYVPALPRRPAPRQPPGRRAGPGRRGRRAGRSGPGTRATPGCTCRGTGWSRSAGSCSRWGWAGSPSSPGPTCPAWLSVVALLLAGLAMGTGVTTTTILALELSPIEAHGEASSSIQLSDVLGSVLGIAGATAAFAALHDAGQDNSLFGAIFLGPRARRGVVVPAGQRIRT